MKAGVRPDPLPANWQALALRGISALGLLIQLPLIWAKIGGSPENKVAGLLVFLPLGVPLLWWKIKFPGWLQMAVAAGTAGGMGMIMGDKLDHAGNETLRSCCQMPGTNAHTWVGAILNWSNGLMLVACVISCVLLCPVYEGRSGKPIVWLKHLGCFGGMWLGMIGGGPLLIRVLAAPFGRMAGMDIAMIIGMMAGAALSHRLFWRSPDREELKP